jgi:transcription antitermination factor NusG
MVPNAKWYAVYTKPRWEKKVAETLTSQKIHNYCPLNRVMRQWSDRKKLVHEPLFTSYVFVHVEEKHLPSLRKINGILHFVTWLGKPAIIKDDEIEVIRRFLNEHTNVLLEKTTVKVEDTIKVTKGTFMDQQGTIVAIKNNCIKVALPSLGYSMYAVLERSSVERLN